MKQRHKATGGEIDKGPASDRPMNDARPPAGASMKSKDGNYNAPNKNYLSDSTAPWIESKDTFKKGGRAARKSGGPVRGEMGMSHGGRKPRASGGRSGSNSNPMSSAHAGSSPPGHSPKRID